MVIWVRPSIIFLSPKSTRVRDWMFNVHAACQTVRALCKQGMSFACPHRSVPYSRWRLDVFRDLLNPGEGTHLPIASFLRSQVNTGCGRHYSSETVRSRDATRSSTSAELNGGGELSTSGEEQSTTPTQYDDVPASNVGKAKSSGEPDPLSTSTDRRGTGRYKKKKPFDPYSTGNRQDVKQAITALTELADKHAITKQSGPSDSSTSQPLVYESIRRPKLSSIPQSPIFKKGRLKDVPLKEHSNVTEQPLRHDPWARMLAEPVRYCQGSGVRLPMSLLSNWSLTRHPESGQVFILPIGLADVENMEAVSSRQDSRLRNEIMNDNEDDAEAPNQEDPLDALAGEHKVTPDSTVAPLDATTQELDSMAYRVLGRTSAHPGTTPAIRILMYDNLINLFSLTASRRGSKRVNTAARLIPKLWKIRFEEARSFESNRRSFESLTGTKALEPPTTEATFDLKKVRWQTDIGNRLLDILRKRVLVACERAARKHAQPKMERRRLVSVIPMARVTELRKTVSMERNASQDDDTLPSGQTSSESVPQLDYLKLWNVDPHDPSTHEGKRPVETTLAPRLFLYLGPNKSTNLTHLTNTRNAMIPPLLRSLVQGKSQRFPVFPIRAMLGEKSYQDLLNLLCRYDYLEPDILAALDTEGGDQLLMLKPSARNEFIEGLLRAVWRLWRFGGGKRWMDPENEMYQEWKGTLEEMDNYRAGNVSSTKGLDFLRKVEEGAIEDQENDDRLEEERERNDQLI